MGDKTINVLIPVSFLPLLLCGVSCDTKFEIAVPTSPHVGVYGQSMVLSCSFPVGGAWDPSSSVILWQRNLEVIHSFYYSRDQLDHQSPHYANRTNLYHSEMERGNASLRLDRTTLEDAGVYTCFVSTQKGSHKKSFSVKIAAKFEIAVPTSPQVGVYGQSMVLSCSFPVGGAWDPSSSVILWQRKLEVIHSFYYSRDQLDHQSPHYANRTNLYHSEMERGNASLRLDRTTLEDAGEYTCFVSTQKGSQKKSFSVKIAAFYPEPHMLISLRRSGEVDLLMTSHGGYPPPSLQWFMGDEQDVTNVTLTQLEQDKDTKLYNVNSKLNLTKGLNSSITFILRNEELGQEIRRNIDLFSENGKTSNSSVRGIVGIYVLIGVLITGVALAIVFIVEQWKQRSSPSRVSEGKFRSSGTADCQGVTSKETPTDKFFCATDHLVSPA